jgi:oxygen-independent coproporphyrinogen-3 oxidase
MRSDAPGRPGLYIHIPFCIKKCRYCGFYSTTDLSLIPDFLAGLRREMALCKDFQREYDTVYLGGGTPSVLADADLEGLLDAIRTAFTVTPDAEITLEANPGDFTPGMLAVLKQAGVNRLNIGCQSFDDATLELLGRRHRGQEAAAAIPMARDAGFTNLGIDLLYGLPGPAEASFSAWLATLETALAFAPEHLSCYQLTLEPGTPLALAKERGECSLPDSDLQARYFFRTAEILEAAGYGQYEVSNFARAAPFQSRHNGKYWRHVPYLGLGPAAHSFDGSLRRWNHRSLGAYLAALAAGKPPVAHCERLSSEELRLEALFLGLRTRRGIDLEDFKRRYGQDLLRDKKEILKRLREERLVELEDGFVRPTHAGMAVADSLALI